MPTRFIVQPEEINADNVVMDIEEIRKINPHRYEMELLSGILRLDIENQIAVAYKDITPNEFWCRGHIPGRPLMPGVLMIEAAAQLCTFYYKRAQEGVEDRFLGFAGLDRVKFRATVVPGDTLIIVAKNTELRTRRAVFDCQGMVGNKLAFEATITGMPV